MIDIRRMEVVVPARNEERRLTRCLRALDVSRQHLHADCCDVRVALVLDRCTDRTAALAADWPGVDVVTSDHGRVGAARAVGVAHALHTAGGEPSQTWIACTDADSTVPEDWLPTHLRHGRQGVDLLLGTVYPDPTEIPDVHRSRWHARHDLVDGHRHVHGANLGIRGDVYLRAGGFPDIAVHEDVLLARSVGDLGGRVVSTQAGAVMTSARLSGRTPGGMARYLRDMIEPARQLCPAGVTS